MNVFIIGATKGTGLLLAEQLIASGDSVTALVRPDSDAEALQKLGAKVVAGDAMDRPSIDAALASATFDAVVTSLGGRAASPEERSDYRGNINAVDAAKAAGIKRFIMLGAIGAGGSWKAMSEKAQEILGPVMKVKTIAEEHLRDSGLDDTIIRGGALGDEPATGNGLLTEDESLIGTIQRADFAALTAEALRDPRTIGRAYGAIDKDLIGKTFF